MALLRESERTPTRWQLPGMSGIVQRAPSLPSTSPRTSARCAAAGARVETGPFGEDAYPEDDLDVAHQPEVTNELEVELLVARRAEGFDGLALLAEQLEPRAHGRQVHSAGPKNASSQSVQSSPRSVDITLRMWASPCTSWKQALSARERSTISSACRHAASTRRRSAGVKLGLECMRS